MRSVFVIGDSISIQYGPYLQKLLTDRYDRKGGVNTSAMNLDTPMGGNGGDSERVLNYLMSEWEKGTLYDILLINCGLHDLKTPVGGGPHQVPMETYESNLRRIAELVRQMANFVVWLRTTDAVEHIHNTSPTMQFHRFHADVVAYNEAADRIFQDAGIPLLDLYSFTRSYGDEAFCDHVHYKEEVRHLQAAFILGYLDARFAIFGN